MGVILSEVVLTTQNIVVMKPVHLIFLFLFA